MTLALKNVFDTSLLQLFLQILQFWSKLQIFSQGVIERAISNCKETLDKELNK